MLLPIRLEKLDFSFPLGVSLVNEYGMCVLQGKLLSWNSTQYKKMMDKIGLACVHNSSVQVNNILSKLCKLHHQKRKVNRG